MNLMRCAATAILFPPLVPAWAQTVEPLKLIATIALPDLREGDFDHFAVDLEGHRFFLAAEENGKVLVFDTNTNSLVHTIAAFQAPHSVQQRIGEAAVELETEG